MMILIRSSYGNVPVLPKVAFEEFDLLLGEISSLNSGDDRNVENH